MAFVQGRVQACIGGAGIYSNLQDNVGNLATTDLQGFWYTNVAYPGYTLRAFQRPSWLDKTVVFTQADINAGWVTICLNDNPDDPPPNTGGTSGGGW
jgi:hypothetical protein